MRDLAEAERFEEATLARDRLRALAEILARTRVDAWLLRPAELVLGDDEGRRFRINGGALVSGEIAEPFGAPCPRDRADELAVLRGWIARHPVRIEGTDVPLAEPADGGAALSELLARLRQAERPVSGRSSPGD
jgi:hypothetical protein